MRACVRACVRARRITHRKRHVVLQLRLHCHESLDCHLQVPLIKACTLALKRRVEQKLAEQSAALEGLPDVPSGLVDGCRILHSGVFKVLQALRDQRLGIWQVATAATGESPRPSSSSSSSPSSSQAFELSVLLPALHDGKWTARSSSSRRSWTLDVMRRTASTEITWLLRCDDGLPAAKMDVTLFVLSDAEGDEEHQQQQHLVLFEKAHQGFRLTAARAFRAAYLVRESWKRGVRVGANVVVAAEPEPRLESSSPPLPPPPPPAAAMAFARRRRQLVSQVESIRGMGHFLSREFLGVLQSELAAAGSDSSDNSSSSSSTPPPHRLSTMHLALGVLRGMQQEIFPPLLSFAEQCVADLKAAALSLLSAEFRAYPKLVASLARVVALEYDHQAEEVFEYIRRMEQIEKQVDVESTRYADVAGAIQNCLIEEYDYGDEQQLVGTVLQLYAHWTLKKERVVDNTVLQVKAAVFSQRMETALKAAIDMDMARLGGDALLEMMQPAHAQMVREQRRRCQASLAKLQGAAGKIDEMRALLTALGEGSERRGGEWESEAS